MAALKGKNFFYVLGVGLMGFVLGSCFQFGASADRAPYRELEKYSKVLQFIEANFVDQVKSADLVEGSIKGMLQTLDPHSAYLTPEMYRQMKTETSGKFGGLGIEVSVKDNVITVIAPIDDTPAFRAGIKAGDRIVRIAGKETKNLNLTEAISLMRGKTGSKISISIMRPGVSKPLEFNLTREQIKMKSVRSLPLEDNLGYVRISAFMERTADDLAAALKQFNENKKFKGVILDLRGNPGGLLDQAVKVSNLFIDEGPIVYSIGRDKEKKEIEYARRGAKLTDVPMVVLVDGSSASASEIVAGALQDHGRAVVAGQSTFGKGSVQTVIPVGDESGLKLTIARYYTPSGRSIQARGINPDVALSPVDPAVIERIQKSAKGVKEVDLAGHFDNEEDLLTLSEQGIGTDKGTSNAKAEGDQASTPLKLEDRIKKDYMVVQAEGILRTMALVKSGLQKPVFKFEEEAKN